MTDFNDLLKKGWGEVPTKKLLPVGTYVVKCESVTYKAAAEEGKNAVVMAVFSAKEALDDVDADELTALLADDYDISANKLFYRIWIEDATSFNRVGALLTDLGVDMAEISIEESFKKAKGHEITAFVTQRTFKARSGESETSNDITQFAAIT